MATPQHYFIESTPYVPGSHLPVIVYPGAISDCQNEDEVKDKLEANGGWVKGGAWNAWFKAHYHPNIHECYGVAKGWSELSIGRGPLDPASKGKLIKVNKGDVMIIPAGVSHCSSTSSEDYRFVVFFPKGQPKWESVWCESPDDTPARLQETLQVPLPTIDPIEGPGGYLVKEWSKIRQP